MARVAINGLGRIGRATLKIVIDTPGLDLVAANEIASVERSHIFCGMTLFMAGMTSRCRLWKTPSFIGGHRLALLNEKEPCAAALARTRRRHRLRVHWRVHAARGSRRTYQRGCAGSFSCRHPSKGDDVETIVHGVNTPEDGTTIISCASCTTNCITPVMEILGRRIGVREGHHDDRSRVHGQPDYCRRPTQAFPSGRAGGGEPCASSTGAAAATTKALPAYRGRFDGVAIRVPVLSDRWRTSCLSPSGGPASTR